MLKSLAGAAPAQCRVGLMAALLALLPACAGPSRTDAPARVEERSQPPAAAPDTSTQIAAYRPPAPPRVARPVPNRAVEVLMRRAEDQRSNGDLDGATVSLERALRITPDDAALWHRLAEVRMAQQRPELVVQLAAKSNALAAADDHALRRDNWHLIARARQALGDAGGANAARRQADALR